MKEKIKGLISAAFTPFNDNGSPNINQISGLAKYYKETGINGVFVNGTTGEGLSLSVEERIVTANEWMKYSSDDFKVFIHVGHNSIAESQRLAKHAQEIGAFAISAHSTCFFKPSKVEDLVEYCHQIASAAPQLPFYYYHMPSMTGVSHKMIDFLELAQTQIPNLAGIKFTSEDLMDYRLCKIYDNGYYDILFGRDEILLAGLSLGAEGAVGSTYNYAGNLYNQLITAFNDGDIEKARELQNKSIELVRILLTPGTSDLSVNKFITESITGIKLGPVRTPLTNLTDQQKYAITDKLKNIEFAWFRQEQLVN